MARAITGETEYQGEFLSWIKTELSRNAYPFTDATQEFPNAARKRSDVIVWLDRAARKGFLEIELKTPSTPLHDATLQADAIRKARLVGAEYLALSNMRDTALYRTPAVPANALLDQDLIKPFPSVTGMVNVDNWLDHQIKQELKAVARSLLLAANDLHLRGTLDGMVIDATVFVDALKDPVSRLRTVLKNDLRSALIRRAASKQLNEWAREQGLTFFVSDLAASLAGQLAYRITGQVLFYYAFRRQQPALPALQLKGSQSVMAQLRVYWDRVRQYDYEALFEPSPLENITLSNSSEQIVADFVAALAAYRWDDIDVDVLGAIFEQLLPESERILLGQYYTPTPIADLVLSFALDEEPRAVLDPAVGSGTFLLRTYDRLKRKNQLPHGEILDMLWGTDISAFPAELAVINLCRQNLDSQANYPRILVRDFFRLTPGATVRVPSAKPMPGGANFSEVDLPAFDAVVGNPPFVRSQQLDDLDAAYKQTLQEVARTARVPDKKFDAFAYFILHATLFLKEEGRIGFVTSASWLTTDFGAQLQRFLLKHYIVRAVIFSQAEPFFPYQEVNTVAVIAEKRPTATGPLANEVIRFLTLMEPLVTLMPAPARPGYWNELDLLVDEMIDAPPGTAAGYRVTHLDAKAEYDALVAQPKAVRNWATPLRTSPIYQDLFGSPGA